MHITIANQTIDLASELATLQTGTNGIGGIASFIGIVRDDTDNLHSLNLEHYPEMTKKKLISIAELAKQKFNIANIVINHRIGEMMVGEIIVFVGASSPHRADCQNAVAFIMDYLKTEAPFWKMETYKNGKTKWIKQTKSDNEAKKNWE